MAAKAAKGASRLESEIERSREEANWRRVVDLAEQLRARSIGTSAEMLATFLIGEGKLEDFLDESPPTENNVARAKMGLIEAKRFLGNVTGEMGQKVGVALDAHLLLGKLHYAMGMYEESLGHFEQADLESLTEKQLASRGLRIVAESYAVKGLSLEKAPVPTTSKYKMAEREQRVVQSFEVAGDLALLYLQEQDKQQHLQASLTMSANPAPTAANSAANSSAATSGGGSSSPVPPNNGERQIGAILETALQRAPILHIQRGKLPAAIQRYRTMLRAVESTATQSLRLTLIRQLAEVLLRGVGDVMYQPPDQIGANGPGANGPPLPSRTPQNKPSESPWKPKRYTGTNLFVPRNRYEEVVLLLVISEAMAVRDAVLSQSPEFQELRGHAFDNATAVYDLLAIALTEWGQASALCESLERALKFSFDEPHVWTQFGLSLVCAGNHRRALEVLAEAHRLRPTKVLAALLAARVCYEHVGNIDLGLTWTQRALQRATDKDASLQGRCHLYMGIGHLLKSREPHFRQLHRQRAAESFRKAQQCDPGDHLPEYYLALHQAESRRIGEAVSHVKCALSMVSEHLPSLHLLALLLSAQKQHQEGLALVEAALSEFPDSLTLLYVKAHFEERCLGGETALLTAKRMLVLWKSMYEDANGGLAGGEDPHGQSETRSLYQAIEGGERDSASRIEAAMSEVASSLSSFQPKPGPMRAWMTQIQVWLLTAEIYLHMDQPHEASACLNEAAAIFPMSHQVVYIRGLIHEHRREFAEAQTCFHNAASINPTHVRSLQHLALVLHYLGSHRLAEKVLRDAARLEPMSYQTWYTMGKVLEALGQFQDASECMATALEIETCSPILPFSSIPICYE